MSSFLSCSRLLLRLAARQHPAQLALQLSACSPFSTQSESNECGRAERLSQVQACSGRTAASEQRKQHLRRLFGLETAASRCEELLCPPVSLWPKDTPARLITNSCPTVIQSSGQMVICQCFKACCGNLRINPSWISIYGGWRLNQLDHT